MFALAIGDGQGYGSELNSWVLSAGGTSRRQIRFKPSAAFSQFMQDQPAYAALDYDPDNRRYLFFAAANGAMNRIYVVSPNDTNEWDMALLALDSSGITPVDATRGGLMNKFRYVPSLRGFVLMTRAVNNLYFLKTA
jgi:hypothetical protein